ncbi:unnamed protein product [Callosobruchus maculatus]|nr:unnamed protein product [Callosobruchus maculatus]
MTVLSSILIYFAILSIYILLVAVLKHFINYFTILSKDNKLFRSFSNLYYDIKYCFRRRNGKPIRKKKHSTTAEERKNMYKASKSISENELENFINLNAVDNPLKCPSCPETFPSHIGLALHSKIHHDVGRYTCHLCDYSDLFSRNIEKHVKKHDTFGCLKCKRVFKNKLSAYKHSKFHPEEYVECELCGLRIKPMYLKKHHERRHTKNPKKKIYKCSVCNKEFLQHGNLRRHYSQRHEEVGIDVSVVCDICGKRLSCRDKLNFHQRLHTGHKPHVCTVCGRGFTQKSMLDGHIRTHTGEKPFVCSYCGKKFAHGAPYRYHVKTHTGEKKFACVLCGKKFIAKSNMRIHMKTCNLSSR